jgi:hypothetical protein
VRIIESSSEDFTPAPHSARVTTNRPPARRGRAVAVTLSAVAVGAMIGSVHLGDLQNALGKTALGGSATAMLSWRTPVHSRLDSSASAVRSSVQKAASLARELPAIREPVPAPSVAADPVPQQPDKDVPVPKPRKIRHWSPRTDDESATIPAASSRSSDAPEETAAVRDAPNPAPGER